MEKYLLLGVNVWPVMVSILLMGQRKRERRKMYKIGLYGSVVEVVLTVLLVGRFKKMEDGYQSEGVWRGIEMLNMHYHIGVDGISIFLLVLTSILIMVCILSMWERVVYRVKELLIVIFVIEFILMNAFTVLDMLMFYILFESILIPMFLLIGIWGSRRRKIHAAYQFFMYTLVGSIMMLIGIVLIQMKTGGTDIYLLENLKWEDGREKVIWIGIFIGMAVKIPMVPVHIWLPEAHVEAPTVGSVILAGLLLKLGMYGMIRYLIPVFPEVTESYKGLVYVLSMISVVYASITTIRQVDVKKIIAYSSIAHMNCGMVGLYSNTVEGIEGAIYLMLSHGIISSGLFLGVGILYERYGTRVIRYYGQIASIMPVYAILMFVLTLGNISFPGTSGFVGEFILLYGVLKRSGIGVIVLLIGVILGIVYGIWMYNRIFFGKMGLMRGGEMGSDLNRVETAYMGILIGIVIYMGVQPNTILEYMHVKVLGMII